MTMIFLFIIMGATHGKAPVGFAPLAIGLGLTLIHLVSIPVTNTSVNPARSTGPALFAGGWALAPALAVLGSAAHRRGAGRLSLPLAQRGAFSPGHRHGAGFRSALIPGLIATSAGPPIPAIRLRPHRPRRPQARPRGRGGRSRR